MVLFAGILAPLVLLHRDMRISYGKASTASVTDSLLLNVFVSLYLGWTCVACIANVAIASTPHDGQYAHLGLGAHVWSIIMQLVAFALASWVCVMQR